MDSSNPLSDREKAFENKYIHDKERQMAKDRANKQTQTESSPPSKDSSSTPIEPEEGGGGTYKEEITKLAAMPS